MSRFQLFRIAAAAASFSFAIVLAIGCGSEEGEGEQSGASSAAMSEAQQIFSTRCVTCHGAEGAGDGAASAGLTPRPRNFQDDSWQTSVTDEHIERIIQYGGAAVGKSPAMPANPDLTSKPEVVSALREHIRSLSGG